MIARICRAEPMTVEDFSAWDPGDDCRHELIDGVPVAMAPPSDAHNIIVGNLGVEIGILLRRRPPCTVQVGSGVILPHRPNSVYVSDLAVTCRRHEPGQQAIPEPLPIVEVLSPGTAGHDRTDKLFNYRSLPSLGALLLVDQDQPFCELHRRLGETRWIPEVYRGLEARLRLESIGLDLPLVTAYANVSFGGDVGGGDRAAGAVG